MKEDVDEQKDLTLAEVESTLVCCLLTSVDAPGLVSSLLQKEMFSDAALGFVFQAAMNRMVPASLLLLPSATQKLRTLSAIFWNIATV